jgi:hypothetical protein
LQEQAGVTTNNVATALDQINYRTAGGGSGYTPTPVLSQPQKAPIAVVTVLFRPFLFEAHNFQVLVSGLESGFLLLLSVWRIRWVYAAVRSIRRQPYVALALVFTLLFIVAFSSFANFGTLVRQRSQLYPLFLVLLAVPSLRSKPRDHENVPVSPATAWEDAHMAT